MQYSVPLRPIECQRPTTRVLMQMSLSKQPVPNTGDASVTRQSLYSGARSLNTTSAYCHIICVTSMNSDTMALIYFDVIVFPPQIDATFIQFGYTITTQHPPQCCHHYQSQAAGGG